MLSVDMSRSSPARQGLEIAGNKTPRPGRCAQLCKRRLHA